MNMRIGMVAGEPSGDLLAGRIIAGLQQRAPGVLCEGIGGPQMQARDFDTWHPMHALTVFGYVDASYIDWGSSSGTDPLSVRCLSIRSRTSLSGTSLEKSIPLMMLLRISSRTPR